jgi:hypothetical protein
MEQKSLSKRSARTVGILQTGARKAASVARDDWTLLAIAATHGLTPVQLQRALYLLGQRFPKLASGGFYEFRPVGSGDYCEQIYRDAEALAEKGFVTIGVSDRDGGRQYRVTPAGAERARALAKHVRSPILSELHTVAAWARTRSVDQLGRGSNATAPVTPSRSSPRSPAHPR